MIEIHVTCQSCGMDEKVEAKQSTMFRALSLHNSKRPECDKPKLVISELPPETGESIGKVF
jgi:hypothetical protein